MATASISPAPRVPPSTNSAAHRYLKHTAQTWFDTWFDLGGDAAAVVQSNGTINLCVFHPGQTSPFELSLGQLDHLTLLRCPDVAREALDQLIFEGILERGVQ